MVRTAAYNSGVLEYLRKPRYERLGENQEIRWPENLPTQLPTQRRIFGAYFELLHENICSVIKGLARRRCFTRRRPTVQVRARPPSKSMTYRQVG